MSYYLYGYRGVSLELAELLMRSGKVIEAFIVDNNHFSSMHNVKTELDIPVIPFSAVEELINNGDKLIKISIAFGEPKIRCRISHKLSQFGIREERIILSDYISKTAKVSDGTILHFGSIISVNAIIGRSCLINKRTIIGHDSTVGDYSVISPGVFIGGKVNIGEGVFIGIGACIRDRVSIGDNAIIGMGAVVTKNIDNNAIVVGNPAKVIKYNDSNLIFNEREQ